jgi:hypothetical protein
MCTLATLLFENVTYGFIKDSEGKFHIKFHYMKSFSLLVRVYAPIQTYCMLNIA